MTIAPSPEAFYADDRIDRRQETLDAQGWSSYELRQAAGETSHGTNNREEATPTVERRRQSRRLGGRAVNEGSDRDHDPYMNGTIEPTEAERMAAAVPGSLEWQKAHDAIDKRAEEAVRERAIREGREHLIPALVRAHQERLAKRRGEPLG
jgi:hypothetical protein